jgi:hypothetical protein
MHYITDFLYSINDKKGIWKARIKQVIQIISFCTEWFRWQISVKQSFLILILATRCQVIIQHFLYLPSNHLRAIEIRFSHILAQ